MRHVSCILLLIILIEKITWRADERKVWTTIHMILTCSSEVFFTLNLFLAWTYVGLRENTPKRGLTYKIISVRGSQHLGWWVVLSFLFFVLCSVDRTLWPLIRFSFSPAGQLGRPSEKRKYIIFFSYISARFWKVDFFVFGKNAKLR